MKSATSETLTEHETIGVRELRDGLSRHLAKVREGAEITVTDHGKPIARIVPAGNDAYARLVASGRLIHPKHASPTLPKRHQGGPISDLIER